MSPSDPRSFVNGLLGITLRLFACAVVLNVTLRLILAVAWPLIIMAGLVVLAISVLALLRRRRGGW